jgi:hypothetical protein
MGIISLRHITTHLPLRTLITVTHNLRTHHPTGPTRVETATPVLPPPVATPVHPSTQSSNASMRLYNKTCRPPTEAHPKTAADRNGDTRPNDIETTRTLTAGVASQTSRPQAADLPANSNMLPRPRLQARHPSLIPHLTLQTTTTKVVGARRASYKRNSGFSNFADQFVLAACIRCLPPFCTYMWIAIRMPRGCLPTSLIWKTPTETDLYYFILISFLIVFRMCQLRVSAWETRSKERSPVCIGTCIVCCASLHLRLGWDRSVTLFLGLFTWVGIS